METQTRFDLNAALENWRQELAAQHNLTADDRRELETHLRDTVAELQRRGLNDEESFWLARKRVGHPREVAEEFLKSDPVEIWRDRLFWMVLAIFFEGCWGSWRGAVASAVPSPYPSAITGIFSFALFAGPWAIALMLVKGKSALLRQAVDHFVRSRSLFRLSLIMLVLLNLFAWIKTFDYFTSGRDQIEKLLSGIGPEALTGFEMILLIKLLSTTALVWLLLKLLPKQRTPLSA